MRRREFIGGLGGAAAFSTIRPLGAWAQQPQRIRRVGVLMNLAADDPEGQARLAGFLQGLQEAGWAVGRNLRVVIRWRAADAEQMRKYAAELVALAPDIILAAGGTDTVTALRQANRAVPIVFVALTDPVATGLVDSLARPGGNTTGFASAEYGMSAKSIVLLKDIAPGVTRAAVLYDTANSGGLPQFVAIQAVAPSLRVELTPVMLRDADEIERAVTAFARTPNGGLIVTRMTEAIVHRDLIIALAARYRLPAVYPLRIFATAGGLISYGPDIVDEHRRASPYVDRILRGEKPADLPVQTPTKYEYVINMKTAKALGLDVPETLLATADEVIE
jgi:putative tryptophan/tyrosine transport system substrate-binding protein